MAKVTKPKFLVLTEGKIGEELTVSFFPNWQGDVQWLKNGKAIEGATKASYKLKPGDDKAVITVQVSNLIYTSDPLKVMP